jgi:hypothetical protein
MEGMLLGSDNILEISTASGGSWLASSPATNAGLREFADTARSTDAAEASTQMTFDHGSAKSSLALWIYQHNLSSTAQVQLLRGTTAGGSDVYNGSFIPAWNFTPRTYDGRRHGVLLLMPAVNSARYTTLKIKDSSNVSGWVELKAFMPNNVITPSYLPDYGLKDMVKDLGSKDSSDWGRNWSEERRTMRGVKFVLGMLTLDLADDLHEMSRIEGRTRPVLYLADLSDMETCQRYGFLGTFEQQGEFAYPRYNRKEFAAEMWELC